jgi:hypothetical protein
MTPIIGKYLILTLEIILHSSKEDIKKKLIFLSFFVLLKYFFCKNNIKNVAILIYIILIISINKSESL